MASQLFHDLYVKALRLDCPLLHQLNALADPKGMFFPFNTTELVPLAELLLQGWSKFKDDLHRVAMRRGMYRRLIRERCLNCGRADCPGAVPIIDPPFMSSGAMLSYLLNKPPESGK